MAEEISEQIEQIEETIRRLNIRQSDHTSELTQEYGYLKFDEDDLDVPTRLSQFIRLALNTEATTVVEFMQHGWCLPTPDLIISVTGGGRQCSISAHLSKAFQRGLVAAAATTNAWLMTSGTNVGVVKEVGAALNNYRYKSRKHGLDVPCIGICTWEYTAGSEQLDRPVGQSFIPDENQAGDLARSRSRLHSECSQLEMMEKRYVRSYVIKESEMKRCDLEPNHTHFLIFDGESANNDAVLFQRAQIEKYLRRLDLQRSASSVLIPIVMILLEGGQFSIKTCCQALQSNTPLVVVKGSGRAADLVADLYEFFCTDKNQSIDNEQDQSLFRSRSVELNSILERYRIDNPWINEIKDHLCSVLSDRKQLIVIFEFDSPRHQGNLEDAILEALLNAAKLSGDNLDEQQCRVAELKLAMAWRKIDYAKKHILTDGTISKWAETDLCQALVDALRRDDLDFVELLMDYGSSLQKLTLNHLVQLYLSSDIDAGLPVQTQGPNDSLIRNSYYSCYFPDQFRSDRLFLNNDAPLGERAAREFFFWALFLDRFELARYLCSKTWNQSVAPLIAAHIYRLAVSMTVHTETKDDYENKANQFDQHAMSIIDRCFDNDENFAVDLLKQPAVAFDNLQALPLAEQARCRAFLASKCVQKNLDHIWYGHINYKRPAIHLRIFLCSLFLPLLPFFSIFLPYVHEHQQIVRTRQDRGKRRNSVMIQTILVSDREIFTDQPRWTTKLMYFYQAPIVRFSYNVIFYVLFLGLFSFVLLIDFLPLRTYDNRRFVLPMTEIVLHICTWTLILEECRHFHLTDRRKYFSDLSNWMTITAIVLYLIAFMMRFVLEETFFMICKIVLCLDLIVWFVGTLHLFAAFERLGPKLLMIFNTMKDLFFFVCFILIFLCAFSITSWSLISSASQVKWNYNEEGKLLNVTVTLEEQKSWSWQLIREITHYGVWKVFGQVDPIVGTDTYSNIAFILAIIFVAIANILLLNVLIALFNITIQNVQEQAHDLWRYQRFLIVNEYNQKTLLPPPFNLIYFLFVSIRFLLRSLQHCRNRRRFVAAETLLDNISISKESIPTPLRISDLVRRERAIAEDYWQFVLRTNRNGSMQTTLQHIEQKIDRLIPCVQDKPKVIEINPLPNKQINFESDV